MAKKVFLIIVIAGCLAALVYLTFAGQEPLPPPLPRADAGGGGGKTPPGHPPVGGSAEAGIKAPDFTLPSLKGNKVRLSDLKGKAVLINFWSSGCTPCLLEMPSFQKLKQIMAGKPFEILTITTDPEALARKTMEQLQLDLTVLLDSDGRVARHYGVYFSPETFIIAPDGTVDNRIMGAANWGDGSVVDYLNRLLEEHSDEGGQEGAQQ